MLTGIYVYGGNTGRGKYGDPVTGLPFVRENLHSRLWQGQPGASEVTNVVSWDCVGIITRNLVNRNITADPLHGKHGDGSHDRLHSMSGHGR